MLTEYKCNLRDWFKGTGGGSGASTMFEDWTAEKKNRYDVDPSIYDHSHIQSRPSILIDNYAKKKKYLTIIFLWDELKDYILSSKYDLLTIGIDEAGVGKVIDDDNLSAITDSNSTKTKSSRSRSPNVKKGQSAIENKTREMVKTVVSLVMDDNQSKSSSSNNDIEHQSLADLTELYKMYMSNLKFHKENGTLSKEREESMIGKIDYIFEVIENCSKSKKRAYDDSISNNSNVS